MDESTKRLAAREDLLSLCVEARRNSPEINPPSAITLFKAFEAWGALGSAEVDFAARLALRDRGALTADEYVAKATAFRSLIAGQ